MLVGVTLIVGGLAMVSRAWAAIVLGILLMIWSYVTSRPQQ